MTRAKWHCPRVVCGVVYVKRNDFIQQRGCPPRISSPYLVLQRFEFFSCGLELHRANRDLAAHMFQLCAAHTQLGRGADTQRVRPRNRCRPQVKLLSRYFPLHPRVVTHGCRAAGLDSCTAVTRRRDERWKHDFVVRRVGANRARASLRRCSAPRLPRPAGAMGCTPWARRA